MVKVVPRHIGNTAKPAPLSARRALDAVPVQNAGESRARLIVSRLRFQSRS
jgi:hypothetical protein